MGLEERHTSGGLIQGRRRAAPLESWCRVALEQYRENFLSVWEANGSQNGIPHWVKISFRMALCISHCWSVEKCLLTLSAKEFYTLGRYAAEKVMWLLMHQFHKLIASTQRGKDFAPATLFVYVVIRLPDTIWV